MPDRRHFLKQLAMLGATTATPVTFALGQTQGQAEPVTEPTDGLFTVPHGQIMRSKTPPRKIIIPDVGEYKVLKGDFHMHTLFSDGSVMPQDRGREAIDNGLDVISITDHINSALFRAYPNIRDVVTVADRYGAVAPKIDQNIPYILANPEAEKSELILVRGVEIATGEWHLNCLFVHDINTIAEANDRRTLLAEGNDWQKMLAISVEQGGFNFWNHPDLVDGTPDTAPFGLKNGEPMRFFDEIEEAHQRGLLHGIEIFNGSTYYPIVSQWCEERDLAPIANTDIHGTDWAIYGHQNPFRPMTLLLAKERTHDSIKEAFFARRTVAFAAGMIIGNREWVEKLFAACVTLTVKPGILELTNKSDIPCLVQAGGSIRELPAMGKTTIYRNQSLKKLTVGNWLVGMNQPLEIALE